MFQEKPGIIIEFQGKSFAVTDPNEIQFIQTLISDNNTLRMKNVSLIMNQSGEKYQEALKLIDYVSGELAELISELAILKNDVDRGLKH
jgi:membrane-bound inhibitor of C-type lysozyme